MNRPKEIIIKLTRKRKTVIAQVGGVAFTATVYGVEPAGKHEAGAVRITNLPVLPPTSSSKPFLVRAKQMIKQKLDSLIKYIKTKTNRRRKAAR